MHSLHAGAPNKGQFDLITILKPVVGKTQCQSSVVCYEHLPQVHLEKKDNGFNNAATSPFRPTFYVLQTNACMAAPHLGFPPGSWK